MAESADALASGASGGNPVEVQVLLSAPTKKRPFLRVLFLLVFIIQKDLNIKKA